MAFLGGYPGCIIGKIFRMVVIWKCIFVLRSKRYVCIPSFGKYTTQTPLCYAVHRVVLFIHPWIFSCFKSGALLIIDFSYHFGWHHPTQEAFHRPII